MEKGPSVIRLFVTQEKPEILSRRVFSDFRSFRERFSERKYFLDKKFLLMLKRFLLNEENFSYKGQKALLAR